MVGGRLWLLLVLLLLAGGCGGGSGSSGFDARAPLEAMALDRAREEQRCIDVTGTTLTVCPLAPAGSAVPAPVDLAESGSVTFECSLVATQNRCTVALSFVLDDPRVSASQLRLAVRIGGSGARWYVAEEAPVALGGNRFTSAVLVPSETVTRPEAVVDAALLVFAGSAPHFPEGVAVLSETQARYAFVAAPVAILPEPR